MKHLWCHELPPLEKATRELMSLLRERKVQDSNWLQFSILDHWNAHMNTSKLCHF